MLSLALSQLPQFMIACYALVIAYILFNFTQLTIAFDYQARVNHTATWSSIRGVVSLCWRTSWTWTTTRWRPTTICWTMCTARPGRIMRTRWVTATVTYTRRLIIITATRPRRRTISTRRRCRTHRTRATRSRTHRIIIHIRRTRQRRRSRRYSRTRASAPATSLC